MAYAPSHGSAMRAGMERAMASYAERPRFDLPLLDIRRRPQPLARLSARALDFPITSKGARSIALSANHSGIEFSRYIAASIGLGRPILPIHCVKIASMSGLV